MRGVGTGFGVSGKQYCKLSNPVFLLMLIMPASHGETCESETNNFNLL